MEEYTKVSQYVIDNYLSKNRLAQISNSLVFYKKDKDGNMVIQTNPWTHHSTLEEYDINKSTRSVPNLPLYIKQEDQEDQQSLQNYIKACTEKDMEENQKEHAENKIKEEKKKIEHLNNLDTIELNRFNDDIFENLKSQIKETIQWDDDYPLIKYLTKTHESIQTNINIPNNREFANRDILRSYIGGINNINNIKPINTDLLQQIESPLIISNKSLGLFLGTGFILDNDDITINASKNLIKIKNTNIIFVFEIINDDFVFSTKQMEPNQDYRYDLTKDRNYIKIDSIEGDYSKYTHSKYFFIFKIPDGKNITLPKENILKPYKEMATISNPQVDPTQKGCVGRLCGIIKNITRRDPQVHSEGGKKTRKQMYSARSRGIITLKNASARSRRIITLKNASAFRKQMHAARSRGIITLKNASAFRKHKKAAKGRHK